ncbi:hypothetical protein EYC80_007658 [Monilinia laxa]|uniref:Myb-like domain-containing protein n=1 Tax=Monilinia laxa TaxID=61186 RepID=A0A5N6JWL3_MONLA|nr:hypothetical protein EYC80_007658 [Monilinia laxa]
MGPPKRTPKPQKPDSFPEKLRGKPKSPAKKTFKRTKVGSEASSTISERYEATSECRERSINATFSPGHAPGYIQWKRAPMPNLMTETEEEKKNRINKKHAPKGKRGTRCVNDGTIDRKPPTIGKAEPSKLIVDFETEEDDEHTNEMIRGEVRYEYGVDEKGQEVNWNNIDFIQHLNNWRSQIIRRNIGKAYDKNEFWTVQEQKAVTGLITDHLNAGKDIDWLQISHEYNFLMKNTKQNKGVPGAPRRYHCQENDNSMREAISTSMPLREERHIPLRTDWVLRREMGYFLAPDAVAIMKRLEVSDLLQLNGQPPRKRTKNEKRLVKKSKGLETVQESSEDKEDLFASSKYGNDQSLVGSPSEMMQGSQLSHLTEPRPLRPRSVDRTTTAGKPSTRRYKKRTAYNEDIIYDKPSTSSNLPISFHAIPLMGGSRQALDTLTEQAAIMYDQLPESQKLPTPRLIVPNLHGSIPAPILSGPSRSGSFGQTSTSTSDASNILSSLPAAPSRTRSSGSIRRPPVSSGHYQHPSASGTPHVPPPGSTRVPIWALNRQMIDHAAAKAATDMAGNSEMTGPSESVPEV